MATASASLAGVPQPGHGFQQATGAPVYYTSYAESVNNPSQIAQQERSFYYNQTRYQPIRPRKTPLYVPAVYRPTERPGRQQLTPVLGMESSFESTGSPVEQRGSGEVSSLGRIVNDEWNEAALGKVTGLPTKNHWKPDTSAQICDLVNCERTFSFFQRRHHCRRCGNIFCADHSHHAVPLDQHARFHPSGTRHRACDRCWADYRVWETARANRSNSISSQGSGSSSAPRPVGAPQIKGFGSEGAQKSGNLAESVPGAWNWSTF